MLTFIVWLVVAVVLVAVVFLIANVMERGADLPGESPNGGGIGAFWRSFRAGLRHRGKQGKPVDTDLESFFAQTVETGPAYVDAEQLGDLLVRAREQATRQLHVGTVRPPK
ncbi:MAG: hypothetical protein FWF90_17180 [Promicromonosporaceae bacterium]|nr:hypothetical protein [Promicromonosporaceae bacterium]